MIFDKLFGKSDDKPTEVCKFESDTEDCSLISQIREKQKQYDVLKSTVNNSEKNERERIQYVYSFLKSLGDYGIDFTPKFFKGVPLPYDDYFRLYHSIIFTLKTMSNDMFDKLINELKTLKYEDDITSNKKSEIKTLENEIAAIKQQLGIK